MKLILYTDTEINVSTSVYNTPLQRICAVNSTQLFPNLSATAFSSASRSYRRKCVTKQVTKTLIINRRFSVHLKNINFLW